MSEMSYDEWFAAVKAIVHEKYGISMSRYCGQKELDMLFKKNFEPAEAILELEKLNELAQKQVQDLM